MPRLESGFFQPLPAQTNPRFNFAIEGITDGFDFKSAPLDWFLSKSVMGLTFHAVQPAEAGFALVDGMWL